MSARIRIAWFSPLNCGKTTAPSISAYVSDQLLPHLRKSCDIELFHNSFESYQDLPSFHYLRAFERHQTQPFNLAFYQVEDGPAAHFTRFHLGLMPGVVLFHDLLVVDSGPVPLYESPWEGIIKKFNSDTDAHNIPWPPYRKDRGAELASPFMQRETALAAVPVFSAERNHAEFKRLAPRGIGADARSSYYLPLPVESRDAKIASPRAIPIIIYSGSPRIECRGHKVFQALQKLSRPYTLRWMIEENERSAALELLKEFAIENFELLPGRSPQAWYALAADADIALHPLFSAYGQPGPYLQISLMHELPCITTNFGAAEYLPESVVYKIQPGEHEAHETALALEEILTRKLRMPIGREFVIENCASKLVADELLHIFARSIPQLQEIDRRWVNLLGAARRELLTEANIIPNGVGAHLIPVCESLGWGTCT
jgi:glycosyltransferase involved in cell wall biosynthesis